MSKKDVVQSTIWKGYSEDFEKKAFDEMNFLQSDDLLFVLLNIPLPQIENDSLLQLAIKQHSVTFLNNDGIRHVVNHWYEHGHLPPENTVSITEKSSYEMLKLLVTHPFKFYFSARGYHWISGVLFMLYFGYICVFAYLDPFFSHNFEEKDQLQMEIALWIMNLGYILYEVIECAEKSIKGYLYTGLSNLLDVLISVIWIILFCVKYALHYDFHQY